MDLLTEADRYELQVHPRAVAHLEAWSAQGGRASQRFAERARGQPTVQDAHLHAACHEVAIQIETRALHMAFITTSS